jgi:hypothetical protein
MLVNYFEILEVPENASSDEIKNAYRAKAKELHPDVNKSPDAHEEFILLTEAYEYLISVKTGKTTRGASTTYEDWYRQERQQARQRAAFYAKMRYEEFMKTDYYKSLSSLGTIVDHLALLVSLVIVIAIPVALTIKQGFTGFIMSLFILLLTLPFFINTLKNRSPFNPVKLMTSVKYIVKKKNFHLVLVSIVNLYTIFRIGLQTLIPLWLLIMVFLAPVAIAFVLSKFTLKIQDRFTIVLISFCIVPLVVNLFFGINYVFSRNPVSETYIFGREAQQSFRGYQESTTIILERNQYDEYIGIRFFFDYEQMKNSRYITYTFRDGLFGIRVMTKYQFEPY